MGFLFTYLRLLIAREEGSTNFMSLSPGRFLDSVADAVSISVLSGATPMVKKERPTVTPLHLSPRSKSHADRDRLF